MLNADPSLRAGTPMYNSGQALAPPVKILRGREYGGASDAQGQPRRKGKVLLAHSMEPEELEGREPPRLLGFRCA